MIKKLKKLYFTIFATVLLISPSVASAQLTDPLGIGAKKGGVFIIIGKIISAILGIVGVIALIMFIYGGLLWMTSAGNSDRVTKGRNTLIWAGIGLFIVLGSYAIVNFLLGALVG